MVLGLVAAVEQQWVTLGPPGVVIPDTPDGDTDAVLLLHAGLDDVLPIGGGCVLDVDFGESALGSGTAEESHGAWCVGTLSLGQVTLRTDTIDLPALSDPFLDLAGHGLGLGIRSLVEAGELLEVINKVYRNVT